MATCLGTALKLHVPMLLALVSIHLSRELGDSLHHWRQINIFQITFLYFFFSSPRVSCFTCCPVFGLEMSRSTTQRLIKMVRPRVNPPKYEGFSKWSTYKRKRACCPASYSSPSCSSRPSRQGWPSSCRFSPGLSGVAHFYNKKNSDGSTAPAC